MKEKNAESLRHTPFLAMLDQFRLAAKSEHAENALLNQTPSVSKIDLSQLENRVIDWSKFRSKEKVSFREKKKLRDHQKDALRGVSLSG